MKTRIVYKITRHGKSATVPDGLKIHYLPGRWTSPKIEGTPIFAYARKQAAIVALPSNEAFRKAEGYELWICAARGVRHMPRLSCLNFTDWSGCYSSLWELRKAWEGWKQWPQNFDDVVVLCEEIRLVKKIRI